MVASAVEGGPGAGAAAEAVEEAVPSVTARVIGSFPDYVNEGKRLGANVFNIPTHIWEGMSEDARWAANQKLLDRGIAAGADFISTVKNGAIRAGSDLEKEVGYLVKQGYTLAKNSTRLVPPQ